MSLNRRGAHAKVGDYVRRGTRVGRVLAIHSDPEDEFVCWEVEFFRYDSGRSQLEWQEFELLHPLEALALAADG